MKKNSIYLVCGDLLKEVDIFLSQFFEKEDGWSNHDEWISFRLTDSGFLLNVMNGSSQNLPPTKNVALEIYFESLVDLEKFAQKNTADMGAFTTQKLGVDYKYHYCTISGPGDICYIEASYSQIL